ncbi:GspE/PulE family protein [Bradyrhizobium brasilense]|uniref:ATPase, T2SS/T4P/T4SS family n=1 Tax=Bradyrhizobium brasilense TaxID=1419277 RepID=A0ABY8JMT0_9BRAD|nr:ATPase, T2SS/T4P/T4SS family [Bradyrhizobium brasilense]WFU66692.1 ATPase, T2SS/T4P/T4SS family [Bradyrhizobium brasilense]
MNQAARQAHAAAIFDALGSTLVADGVLDSRNLERAQRAAAQSGERLDQVLLKLGLVPEARLIATLGRACDLEVILPGHLPSEPVMPETISTRFVRVRKVLPLRADATQLSVALVDPLDTEPVQALAYLTGKTVHHQLIAPADFDRAVQSLYGAADALEIQTADSRLTDASETDVQRLRDIANEAPVIRLVNQMISEAVDARASDIHVEPAVDGVAVRYRIDGSLTKGLMLPTGLRAAITSRIKIMAKLDIAERRLPQDGRIKIPVRGVDIDFRISTIPTVFGESIVMRILDRSRVELDLEALGFSKANIATLSRLTAQPNGIVLVTGPTGSGKTTTLYTVLKQLNQPDLKIFTVEDPIEYQIAGINQVQVQPAIGLDFPHALRSILRQDPDIIMIGEIRDVETARIAIQASLTGHLVLSTLHTNSAAATVTRLLDMGTENYLLASTVNGILAQRLTRRICPHCARPHDNAASWAREIQAQLAAVASKIKLEGPAKILAPVGCEACRDTGFVGRLAIAELMPIDERQKSLILSGASDAELEAAARHSGMKTLHEDGLGKVWAGETTIEDVLRITRAGG